MKARILIVYKGILSLIHPVHSRHTLVIHRDWLVIYQDWLVIHQDWHPNEGDLDAL